MQSQELAHPRTERASVFPVNPSEMCQASAKDRRQKPPAPNQPGRQQSPVRYRGV